MSWLKRRSAEPRTKSATAGDGPSSKPAELEQRTKEIGLELLDQCRSHQSGFFSAKFWSDQLVTWSMKDTGFRTQLFRFIDVFPMLKRPEDVHECLIDYLTQPGVTLPPGLGLGLKAGGMAKGMMARTVADQIRSMAGNFIAGTNAKEALPVLRTLWNQGVGFSVDVLGEACVSDAEAHEYQSRYLDLVETLPDEVAQWPAKPNIDSDYLGPIPRAGVSVKISALSARTDPIDFEGTLQSLMAALEPILRAAARKGVMVYFDIEQYALKDLTLSLFERCCEAVDFPAGIALQAYLRSGLADAERLIGWAKKAGRQVSVRLIKGAYWDYELINSDRLGWPVPVWSDKRETDANFENMATRFVENMPRKPGEGGVKLALGSHNVRSIAFVLALLERHGLPTNSIEMQKLYGMADSLRGALCERGLRVREYLPVGEMLPGMAYLVRRLLENTSNQSWLRAGLAADASSDALLASPHLKPTFASASLDTWAQRHELSAAVEGVGNGLPLFNEPTRNFSRASERDNFAKAVAETRVPTIDAKVDAAICLEAIKQAVAALPGWRDHDAIARAKIIADAGARMRADRDKLSAVMVREAGKPSREADADVCEAIDFCEFYPRESVALFQPQRLGRFVGELNHQWYQPRGVTAVISPWNFPLAICCGMTTAALATGNPVLVKPSSQTRGIALLMCEALWQAGVPKDVLHFLPGAGREVGDLLVGDPRVALIAFTGSKEIGLRILRMAGDTPPGQEFVKKIVCEMGGKNAVIIDESADLDEAVLGVRQSAFGYCGQKCSACSRVIVLDGVHDQFLARLVESTRALTIGDPAEPGTDFGPVIDEKAASKIREYIEIAKGEGRLELACEVPAGLAERVRKPYVGPHIFSGIEPQHRLAREEVFGPVLAVMRARDFEHALQMANDSEYKLTGGVFSRRPAHLESARKDFRVGNLYLNRGITGALVGRQPFGGFAMSGVGTKAGGREYLLHFVEPRCCTESTMRHGFAPGLE